MKVFGVFVIIFGIFLFGYSTYLEPYTDETEYQKQYNEINTTEEFIILRDKFLTVKYDYEDYGFTIIVTGLVILFVFWQGWRNLKSPDKGWKIIIIGILAVIIEFYASSDELDRRLLRGDFPHWADTGIIGFVAILSFSIIVSIWVFFHSFLLINNFSTSIKFRKIGFKHLNIWLVFVILICVYLVFEGIFVGSYSQVILWALMSYFHLSILAGRQARKMNLNKSK